MFGWMNVVLYSFFTTVLLVPQIGANVSEEESDRRLKHASIARRMKLGLHTGTSVMVNTRKDTIVPHEGHDEGLQSKPSCHSGRGYGICFFIVAVSRSRYCPCTAVVSYGRTGLKTSHDLLSCTQSVIELIAVPPSLKFTI